MLWPKSFGIKKLGLKIKVKTVPYWDGFFMSGHLHFSFVLLDMTTISGMLERFKELDLKGAVPEIIMLTSGNIISLNQAQLYNHGIKKDGSFVGTYQWDEYEAYKKTLNPNLGGMVDLYLTGSFYSGFFVKTENGEIIIGSEDSKSDALQKKYGVNIFGLTDFHKSEYTKKVFFVELKKYIENITKLSMV